MTHHDLPLPDYDNLPTGSLESRIRTLDADGVGRLIDYEKSHANRPAVLQILENRAEGLRSGDSPTSGSPLAPAPEVGADSAGGEQAAQTEGPPVNPPSQGVPTNPAQPRK